MKPGKNYPTNRHMVILAVFLVLMEGDKILLQRRQNTGHGDGMYSLVGGHVDKDESSKSALCREAMEEIGVKINQKKVKFVYALHRKQEHEERIDIFFQPRDWEGQIKICEPNKCSELAFYSINQLPLNTLPYIKYALRDIKTGKKYGEYGWSSDIMPNSAIKKRIII